MATSSATLWDYCVPAVAFAALAARAFARFATSAAFRAGDSFFFAIAFFSAGFFACFAAWNASHLFFVAATIAALPAALILRFGFGVSFSDGDSDWPFDSAHRFRWASLMRFRAAALIFRRVPIGASGVTAGSVGAPVNRARSSAI